MMKISNLSKTDPKYIEYYNTKLSKLKELYYSGHSCTKIAKLLKMSRNDVSLFLKNENVKIDPDRHKKKFTIQNENIFKNIDTPEKAQILGLIYADGCIYKNHNVTNISLKEDDKEYLENINSYIGFSRPVSIDKKETLRFFKENQKTYKCKNSYSIRINNKKIKDDLIKHGVEYYKSYTDFSFPENLSKNFYNSFILGYFEGDGCITFSKIKNRKCISKSFTVLCQPKMSVFLKDVLKNELNIDAKLYTRKARPNLRTVSVTKNKDIIKIYHWLYRDVSFYMKRKHDIFVYILNNLKIYGYNIEK